MLVKLSICNDLSYNYYVRFAVYIGFSVIFMIIAASIGYGVILLILFLEHLYQVRQRDQVFQR